MMEIRYSSFAVPPRHIKLNKSYCFGQDAMGYFYSGVNVKNYLPLDEIMSLFSPVNGSWEAVLKEAEGTRNEI